MGVRDLWQLIQHAAEVRSLTELTVTEGFERGDQGGNTFDIGVDVSMWIKQSAPPFRHQHHLAGQNPELLTIFSKMQHLAALPVRVVLVYDGEKRPNIKRGVQVRGTPHWLTTYVQQMADLFGFVNHTAPGEAEAELAMLNQAGCIDAVITDDGDALVFGALQVIRNHSIKADGDDVQVFSHAGLGLERGGQLTRGSLVLIALLAGGDYDTVGIPGCGALLAGRVSMYGLGEDLLDIVRRNSGPDLQIALSGWRSELRRALRDDPKALIGRKCGSLASKIGDEFPDLVILQAYISPLTSSPAHHNVRLTACQPDIAKLAHFCYQHFGWSPRAIHEKFQKRMWPAVVIQMLVQLNKSKSILQPSSILRVTRRSTPLSTLLKIYHCRLDATALICAAQSGIAAAQLANRDAANPTDTRHSDQTMEATVAIPLSILAQALPKLVHPEDREDVIVQQLDSLGFGGIFETTDSDGSSSTDSEGALGDIEHRVVEDGEDLGYRSDDSDIVTREIERAFEMYDLYGPFGLGM